MNSNDTTTSGTTSTSAVYDDPTVYDRSDLDEFKGKLQEVADDDSLSASEKADAIEVLRGEEVKEIRVAYGAEPDVDSAPEGDTSDVAGDPLSARYGTATTPAEEPVTLASDDATSDVAGDTVYSEMDGISTVTTYDAEGNIELIQQDTDGNGSYETSAELANDIVKVSQDTDGDDHPDQINYLDATGQIIQQDTLVDGKVTQTMVDTDGDGYSNTTLTDTTGDGHFDTLEIDSDYDQITNTVVVDTDGDGKFDKGATDADNNISLETTFTSADVDLGSIEDFETVVPSTQFDAPVEPAQGYEPQSSCDSYDQV